MTIAATPAPPYYAAIFSSIHSGVDRPGHETMGERMAMLAMQQPGFLGFEFGPETPERFSLFVSYWKTAEDIAAWKRIAEHEDAQQLGRETWYVGYKIRIARVERDYGRG